MRYVGLDVHLRTSTFCVLNENGSKLFVKSIRGSWAKLLVELAAIERPFAVCFEASNGYGYLFDQLKSLARDVVVAHPGELRLIFRSKRKNDRVDAEKLAKLLFLGEVPSVHVPSIDVRDWRSMIEHRQSLIRERSRIKNATRSLLRSHGFDPRRDLWSLKGLRWLTTVELPTDAAALRRDILLERLQSLEIQIDRVESALKRSQAAVLPCFCLLRFPASACVRQKPPLLTSIMWIAFVVIRLWGHISDSFHPRTRVLE